MDINGIINALKSAFFVQNEEYKNVKDDIFAQNRNSLIIFSVVADIIILLMYISSMRVDAIATKKTFYMIYAIILFVIFVLAKFFSKNKPWLVGLLCFVFIEVFFFYGIALGTIMDPSQLTVSYIVFLLVAPLIFVERPIISNINVLLSIVVYVILAKMTQTDFVFINNMTDVIPFGILSMFIGSFTIKTKINHFNTAKAYEFLSFKDQLTGIYNRRSYDKNMNEIETGKALMPYTIIMIDINGLKRINDELGHNAGDELIASAAKCIETVANNLGKAYRIGGDEFAIIIEGKEVDYNQLIEQLKDLGESTKGKYIDQVSFAAGAIQSNDHTELKKLVREADKKMYQDKAIYYQSSGMDRRGK